MFVQSVVYVVTREVAGKSGARLDNLSDRALHPKSIKNYSEALPCIEKCVTDTVELKDFEGQELTDSSKRQAFKRMLP